MDVLKVLIIGLGSIGRKHVNALMQLEQRFEIYALRSNSSAAEYPNVTNIFSLDTLTTAPDFFIVSNPTSLHSKTIKTLIDFGKPIFIEKPSVMYLHEGQIIAEELAEKNLTTYVACNLRFLEVLKFTKTYLQEKNPRINEVNIYGGSYMPDWRPQQNFREIYSANKEMGGGIHLDFIHEIDYLYWFLGTPKQKYSILRSTSSLKISAVDYANYIFLYEKFTASVILNYYRKDRKRYCEIVCEEGTLFIEIEKGKVYFNQNLIFTTQQTILDTYSAQMKYFIHCIMQKNKPMNDFSESVEVLKMCLNDE